ncbi:hypothetical protein MTR67_026431 [Solanum verrucosum]|uniref:Tf2-1-like SH3-like domain-containing protein n=1 Tax=Solanum verrucosum TaxID=315347 RepID=A0AAF0R0H7_SOLVR|nr:hypothetical protein MTR67_026431 [Solanum verrucosum]
MLDDQWISHFLNFSTPSKEILTTKLITKHPVIIEFFPDLQFQTKLLGSAVLGRDLIIGFDIFTEVKGRLEIITRGITLRQQLKSYKSMSKLFQISDDEEKLFKKYRGSILKPFGVHPEYPYCHVFILIFPKNTYGYSDKYHEAQRIIFQQNRCIPKEIWPKKWAPWNYTDNHPHWEKVRQAAKEYQVSILRRVGRVAYELELPSGLKSVHPVFHVLMLRKCVGDPSRVVPVEDVQITEELSYEETPVAILDRQVRKLRTKEVASVKVLWRNKNREEVTWEVEDGMTSKYHHLFHTPG